MMIAVHFGKSGKSRSKASEARCCTGETLANLEGSTRYGSAASKEMRRRALKQRKTSR